MCNKISAKKMRKQTLHDEKGAATVVQHTVFRHCASES